MAKKPIPTRRTYASDTVKSDTATVRFAKNKPFIHGGDSASNSRKTLDSVRRSRTEKENKMLDSQGNRLDDATIAILRGGSDLVKTPPKKTAPRPKPPTRNVPFKKLGITPRGKARGER